MAQNNVRCPVGRLESIMTVAEVKEKETVTNVFVKHPELEKANHYSDLERESVRQKAISDRRIIDPLIIYKDKQYLVWGYEELAISEELGLSIEVKEVEFESVSHCIAWLGEKKLAIPSLNSFQKAEIGLTFWKYWKDLDEAKYGAKSPLKKAAMDRHSRTDKHGIAGIKSGLSHNTVYKVSCILDSKDKKVIEECRKGETSIDAGYKLVNAEGDNGDAPADDKKIQRNKKQKQKEINSLAKYCSEGFSGTNEKLDEHGLKFFILRWNEEHPNNRISNNQVQKAVESLTNEKK